MTPFDIQALSEMIVQIRYQLKHGPLPSGMVVVYANESDAEALERILAHIEKDLAKEEKMSREECQAAADLFNKLCPSLPSVRQLTDARIKALRAAKTLLQEVSFEEYFKKVEASDFISGRRGKWNGASFDWILKKANLLKILEGNYDNRRGQAKEQESSFDIEKFFQAARKRTERIMSGCGGQETDFRKE